MTAPNSPRAERLLPAHPLADGRKSAASTVRYVPPSELRRIFGDIDFAEVHQIELREARHVSIDPPLDWRRIVNALIIAIGVGAAFYFIVRPMVAMVSF